MMEPTRTMPDSNVSFCRTCGWTVEKPGSRNFKGNTFYVNHDEHPQYAFHNRAFQKQEKPMSDIDKFFDKVEGVVDKLVARTGTLGVVATSTVNTYDQATIVWHYGRYRQGLVCEPEQGFELSAWKERPPKGGAILFCRRCILTAMEVVKADE